MPMPPDIDELARQRGVATTYRDARGAVLEVDHDALAAVIDALGEPLELHPDAVVVAWDGRFPVLQSHDARVVLDDGTAAHPEHMPVLPFGYHDVMVGDEKVGVVISAPRHAPRAVGRRWGVFLPLYALRTGHTAAMATYPELGELFEWVHRHDGDLVLTLPLLPLYLDEPAEWSPYVPATRRLWGEHFVDVSQWRTGDDPAPPAPKDRLLDHRAVRAWHTPLLDRAAAALADSADLHRWAQRTPLAVAYADYRGRQAVHGRHSSGWAAPAAPDPHIVRRHLVGTYLADRQVHAVAAAARRRGQALALDVAIGTHPDGFDVWREGDLFVRHASVGAPPDPLFMGGQDWGFPPVHPQRSRATGHQYFRDTLRHHLRVASVLRLDHVMGLTRLWWVPAGARATDGAYVSYPLDELMAVVCLEAHLAGAVIVGENLGTVPDDVDQALRSHQLLGIHVGQESLHTIGTAERRRSTAAEMMMLSTHDSVPFAGYWHGADISRAHRLGQIDAEEHIDGLADRAAVRDRVVAALVHDGRLSSPVAPLHEVLTAVLTELAGDPAPLVVVPLEDCWLEAAPQNTPGTSVEEPNWRRTMRPTLEQIDDDPDALAVLATVAAARRDPDAAAPAG
jgi:4-alpha-glucanotransferase